MIDDDVVIDTEYWCPLCGDPRAVCEIWGGCDKPIEDDFDNDFDDDDED